MARADVRSRLFAVTVALAGSLFLAILATGLILRILGVFPLDFKEDLARELVVLGGWVLGMVAWRESEAMLTPKRAEVGAAVESSVTT